MLDARSDLPTDQQKTFEAFVADVDDQLFDRIAVLLADVDEPAVAQRVYDLAFEPNDVLPKRERRPELHSAILAAASADALGLDDEERATLLEFTVAIQEYYDVLDDLIDGDVAPGHETEVQLVAQVLLPLAVDRLGRLGSDAVAHWAERALELVTAPHAELQSEPSPEAYDEIVARQSVLFGFVPGVAAVAAGCDDAGVQRASSIGRSIYRHGQFARDFEQHVRGDDDPWNAAALHGDDAVIEELRSLRATVEDLAAAYPDPARIVLQGLVALDVDAWQTELADG